MQFYTYRMCTQHLQTKIESFSSGMTFAAVVWCYCYCHIIIFIITITIITITIIIIIIIIIIINNIIIIIIIFSNCDPSCTLQSVPAHLILYIPAVGAHKSLLLPPLSKFDFIVLLDNCCPLSWIVYLYDCLIFFVQLWQ